MPRSREEVGKLVAIRLGDRQVNWLAEETGIDRTALAAIKSGRVGVGLERGARLHAALGGNLSDYITDPRAYARAVEQEEPAGAAAAGPPSPERFAALERRVALLERRVQRSNHGSA